MNVKVYYDLVSHRCAEIPLDTLRRLAPDSGLDLPSLLELNAVPPYQFDFPVEAGGDLVDWLLTDGWEIDGSNPLITEMTIE